MTRSSANNITHGGSFPISACSTSMISIKRSGLSAYPWCNPTATWKYSVSPVLVDTRVSQSLYISCIIATYHSGTPFFRRHHHINSRRGTRSYATFSVVRLIYEDHIFCWWPNAQTNAKMIKVSHTFKYVSFPSLRNDEMVWNSYTQHVVASWRWKWWIIPIMGHAVLHDYVIYWPSGGAT